MVKPQSADADLDAEFEKYKAENPTGRGPQCSVCKLPQEFRDWIDRKVGTGEQKSVIGRYIRKKGHHVSDFSIGHHAKEHITRR